MQLFMHAHNHRPVNVFQTLRPQLSAVSGILHEVIKFWRFSSICGNF